MTERQIIHALQKLLMAYQRAGGAVAGRPAKVRRKRIELAYIRLCDRFSLCARIGMPYHIDEVFRYVLLVDEIMNGTLFCF